MNEAGGVSVWGPYFKGPAGAPFGKSDTDSLTMKASVPTQGLSRIDVEFDRVTLLRSDAKNPPWNEGDSLTAKCSWDELRGILPNELGVCFGTTQTLEILGEGNEVAGARGNPAAVAQTIIGAKRGETVEYPEFLVLRDGTTVPTCSRRGLMELAVRTQEAYESQSLARLQQISTEGTIHTVDELKEELKADRDHAIGLCVRPHSSSEGLHAVMLRSTESGFVVFDPNFPGEHRAVLIQTSDVASIDGKPADGGVMIRYSVEGGREIWATVTGVLRERA